MITIWKLYITKYLIYALVIVVIACTCVSVSVRLMGGERERKGKTGGEVSREMDEVGGRKEFRSKR